MDKKFKIFVIVALVVLTAVAGGALFLIMSADSEGGNGGSAPSNEAVGLESLEVLPMAEPINANLKMGEDKIPHMTRLTIGVQINKEHDDYATFVEQFGIHQLLIRDSIIRIVRSLEYSEMIDENAQQNLGEKIALAINELLSTDIVHGIFFQDFFVQ